MGNIAFTPRLSRVQVTHRPSGLPSVSEADEDAEGTNKVPSVRDDGHGDPLRASWLWIAIVALALLLAGSVTEHAEAQTATKFCKRSTLTPYQAINCTWPLHLRVAAKRVAECESTASAPEHTARRRSLGRWARNGSYLGVFQIGPAERAAHGKYSVGSPAVAQTRSAYSLYRDRGWQPWSCA